MNIIGIDPASSRLAIWSGVDSVFMVMPQDAAETCGVAFRALSDFLTERMHDEYVIYMERPITRNSAQGGMRLAEAQGALMAAAAEFGVEVRRVDNMTWKKSLIGNGRAEKEEIAAYVKDRDTTLYDACGGNQDLLDALCVYWYGKQNYPLIAKARDIHAKAQGKKRRSPSRRG